MLRVKQCDDMTQPGGVGRGLRSELGCRGRVTQPGVGNRVGRIAPAHDQRLPHAISTPRPHSRYPPGLQGGGNRARASGIHQERPTFAAQIPAFRRAARRASPRRDRPRPAAARSRRAEIGASPRVPQPAAPQPPPRYLVRASRQGQGKGKS